MVDPPLPLTEHDRAGGRMQGAVDAPNRDLAEIQVNDVLGGAFVLRGLVADNLDIGRLEVIELVFKRGERCGAKAGGQYKTKIVTYGTEVNVNAFYRHPDQTVFERRGGAACQKP